MSQHLWVNFQQIKRQVRIEQVVKAYGVSLHRVGSELRGACPLPTHSSEKSRDSFSINTARNIWCCQSASCMNTREGKIGGTVIDLVAIMENCSMREAALRLQDRYATPAVSVTNNPLPPSDESHAMNPPLRFTLRDIATSYPYLAQRGVRKETAEIFGVGYYSGPGLQHGRIVIPVQNARQELVAYAGRAIDGQEPKYLLPPGFRKSLELFNLCRARNAESRTVIVVEGFFDTMAVHQAGHRNVVGLMAPVFRQPKPTSCKRTLIASSSCSTGTTRVAALPTQSPGVWPHTSTSKSSACATANNLINWLRKKSIA
jgi:DNA primase